MPYLRDLHEAAPGSDRSSHFRALAQQAFEALDALAQQLVLLLAVLLVAQLDLLHAFVDLHQLGELFVGQRHQLLLRGRILADLDVD